MLGADKKTRPIQHASPVPYVGVISLFGNFLAFKAAKLIAIVRLSYFGQPGCVHRAISTYLSFVRRERECNEEPGLCNDLEDRQAGSLPHHRAGDV